MSILTRGQGSQAAVNGDVALLHAAQEMFDGATAVSASGVAMRTVFSNESADNGVMQNAIAIEQSIESSMKAIANKLNIGAGREKGVVLASESAAVTGYFAGSAAPQFVHRNIGVQAIQGGQDGTTFFVSAENVPNYAGKRDKTIIQACESFDNMQQRDAALYSFAYNYAASIQDPAMEALYPLLSLPADQIGFGILVNRLTVHQGLTHEVSGRAQVIQKVDLCRAGVDHTVLSRKKTAIVPIHRATSKDSFVDAAVIVPWNYTEEGANFKTSALKVGVEVDLIGLSMTDAQLSGSGGASDQTDVINPAISVDDIFVKAGDDILKIKIYGRHGANFTYNTQGRQEDRLLNFDSRFIVLTPKDVRADGSALTTLAILKTKKLSAVLRVILNGRANTEFATGSIMGQQVSLVRVVDENGKTVDTASADYAGVAAALAGSSVIGWTVHAWKENLNMRDRGDLIDRNQFTQLFEVPLLAPITYQRPIGQNGENDAADFETLVTTTRFRMLGDGVTATFDFFERVRDFVQVPFLNEDAPSGLGAARFHVKPYCADLTTDEFAIDVAKLVSTLDNKDAVENVQAVIINKLRDVAFSMFVYSEYQSAMKALGLDPAVLTLTILTDPYIRRYLTISGDLRPLTEKFNVQLNDVLDKRMRGRIFMAFTINDESRNQAPNILNFGQCVMAPEVVVSANVMRNGGNVRETIVQPRYLYVMHAPVCAMLRVKNISAAFDESFLKVRNKPI